MTPIFLSEPARAHGNDWLLWNSHLIGKPDIAAMELGTFMGESAEFFCENIFYGEGTRFYCVDYFQGSKEHGVAGIDCSHLEEQARARLARFPQCKIIKGYTHEVLRNCTEKLSFIYVDAAHDTMNVLRDAVLAFDLLLPGGTMVFDDVLWEALPDPLDQPRLSVESFLKLYSRHIEIIQEGKWQACIRKK